MPITISHELEERLLNQAQAEDLSVEEYLDRIPGKRGGAWVFKGTRTPISTVFENLQDITLTSWWKSSA